MRGFRAGFRHRSLLVLVAALLLLPLGLLGFEKLFTSGAWTAVPLKYWISDTFDSFTYVSWGAGALKLRPPAKPLVVLVGGSSARESIWSGEALANEIELAGGPDVAGRSLAGPHQSLGGSLAIIDNLPNTPTTVLYGINFHRLGGGMKQQFKQIDGRELLLKSETLRRFAAERSAEYRRSYSILPGIFQSLATRASALGSSVAQGRGLLITYDVHSTDRKPDLTPVELAKVNRWINSPERLRRLRKGFPEILALLDESLLVARRRGLDVVLVELPHNPAVSGTGFRAAQSYYQGHIRELAMKYGITYLDFSDDVDLTAADFHDLSHVKASGRTKWQMRLARELARLYRQGALPRGATAAGVAAGAQLSLSPLVQPQGGQPL